METPVVSGKVGRAPLSNCPPTVGGWPPGEDGEASALLALALSTAEPKVALGGGDDSTCGERKGVGKDALKEGVSRDFQGLINRYTPEV